ncbi:MAG: cytochrome b/b6 domain-containing protein [Bacteroidia bacterium]|nr:cytochrome b/b6 domain-containing protein [Bacteroidia bacterium]
MYLYPLWIRLWHFVNAILIMILIITGAAMQFADADHPLLTAGFAGSARLHDVAAIILTISYIAFVAGNIVTGNSKYYRISKKNLFSGTGKQLKYFLYGMFRKEKQPFPVTMDNKFNPLEKVSYNLIMYIIMPLLILSGIIMLFQDLKVIIVFGTGLFIFTDILHIILGFLVSVFLIIHVYCCTIGPKPGSLFRGLISGYQESEEQ